MRPGTPDLSSSLYLRPAARCVLLLLLAASLGCSTATVDRSEDQTRRGVRSADQSYWEEAEFRWLKALARDSGDARALNNLAVHYERDGEFAEARDFYDRARAAATPAERAIIDRNLQQFNPIWQRIQADEVDSEDPVEAVAPEALPADPNSGVSAVEILIAVPDQGPNLAGYDRLLVGPFATAEDSETSINNYAVRYLRRRITQRTFFETQDQIERPLEPERRGDALVEDPAYWVERAAMSRADLVLTGHLGLTTRPDSTMVRERIRTPEGDVREVARFQDSIVYSIRFDYVLLRGEDGQTLLDGSTTAEQSFPADDNLAEGDAVFETLEELLPQILDAITPRRSEQSRYLIY